MTRPGGEKLRLTLDTNQLDESRVDQIRSWTYLDHEIACVSVSGRERGNFAGGLVSVPEVAVWGESLWDRAVWATDAADAAMLGKPGSSELLEAALAIISNNSFPPMRERGELTAGQRRQLRDAMVFEGHARAGRHVLVTNDVKGFVRDGRRELLERLGRTHIVTSDEFRVAARDRRLEKFTEPMDP